MARRRRPDWQDALHHIIARGIDGKAVFQTCSDKQDLINRFEYLVPDMDVEIYAWAVMPNHLHLLTRTGDRPICSFMHRLLTGYATSYNRRNERQGHVFQGRFKSIPVQEDTYFLRLVKYIHCNPLKAGIVDAPDKLEDYPWCGHGSMLGTRKYLWHNSIYALSKFGQDAIEQKMNYRRLVIEEYDNNTLEELTRGTYCLGSKGIVDLSKEIKPKNGYRVLGDKDFALRILKKLRKHDNGFIRDRRKSRSDVQKLFSWIESKLGFTRSMISGNARGPGLCDARAVAAWIMTNRLGLSQTECAGILGITRPGAQKAIARGEILYRESTFIQENAIW